MLLLICTTWIDTTIEICHRFYGSYEFLNKKLFKLLAIKKGLRTSFYNFISTFIQNWNSTDIVFCVLRKINTFLNVQFLTGKKQVIFASWITMTFIGEISFFQVRNEIFFRVNWQNRAGWKLFRRKKSQSWNTYQRQKEKLTWTSLF